MKIKFPLYVAAQLFKVTILKKKILKQSNNAVSDKKIQLIGTIIAE